MAKLMWVKYNPNPTGRSVGDCAVRAVAKALNIGWEKAYVLIVIIRYSADSDFARAIDGRQADEILPIFDELMSTIKMTNERLYNGVMRKLQQ